MGHQCIKRSKCRGQLDVNNIELFLEYYIKKKHTHTHIHTLYTMHAYLLGLQIEVISISMHERWPSYIGNIQMHLN